MNENYLKALEGLEELKRITFSKENINKRLGLETFKIDRELLQDEQITSTFSSTEINKLIYVLSTESLIQRKIKPLIEDTFKYFSRSIKLINKDSEKIKCITDFNDKIVEHYLFLSQNIVLSKHHISEDEIKLFSISSYLFSIITGNIFDINSIENKIDEIKKIPSQEYLNNLKIYLTNVDYLVNLKISIQQILKESWKSAILDFEFLNEFYTISTDLNGIPVFEKKKKKIQVTPLTQNNLFDIWLGKDTIYLNEIIIILKKEQLKFKDLIFISEIDGKLYWNKSLRNWNKYLAGFYRVLLEKKWVNNDKSAPQIVEILKETFNFENKIDSKNFRTGAMEIDKRFKEPFEFIEDK
jgi:hypothetical protein